MVTITHGGVWIASDLLKVEPVLSSDGRVVLYGKGLCAMIIPRKSLRKNSGMESSDLSYS